MKIYLDLFTQDELVSDSYGQMDPFEDSTLRQVGFEVKSQLIKKVDEDYGIAANQDEDAEGEAAAEASGNVENVIDIVDKFSLQEQYLDKATFMAYIKRYLKNVCDTLEKTNADRVAVFKQYGALLVKKVLSCFDDCTIYIGENSSDLFAEFKALPVIARYVGEEPTPRFIFLIDGLREEKC
jgi:hypothetical protein